MPSPPPLLVPFVYSHVEYTPHSPISFFFALTSLFPVVALSALLTLICSRRDLHTMSLLVGLVVCEGVNHVVKYAVKAPRPYPGLHPAFDSQSPYAWPSDHAQLSTFLAVYIALWASRNWRVGKVWRGLAGGMGLCGAGLVGVGRVYLGYHTLGQVAAGSALGAACAIVWFVVVERVLRPHLFPAIAMHPLARWAWVRDLSKAGNVLKAEYEACAHSSLE